MEVRKLPRLWHVPSDKDIGDMLIEAQNFSGQFIEQPWSAENQDRLFKLLVSSDNDGDPLWVLEEVTLNDSRTIWEHRTIDTGLINSLVLGESTGEVIAPKTEKSTRDIPGTLYLRGGDSQQLDALPPDDRPLTGTTSIGDAILEGDISKVRLTTVLQSIQMSKMSGRLAIRSESCGADIYFAEGEATHASDGVETGDEVVLELIQLSSGKFKFLPDESTVRKTVQQRLDRLLLEAIALLDQSEFLSQKGLKSESYLVPSNPKISLEDFLKILDKGAPVDIELQKSVFKNIGQYKTLLDLLRATPMRRSQWVPTLFNFVSLELVRITDRPPHEERKTTLPAGKPADVKEFQQVFKPLLRPTGLLIYPALQYFISLECARHEVCGLPVTLMVISITNKKTGQSPDIATIHEIFEIIEPFKSPIDIAGHFQMFDYAIVMPNTESRGAAGIAAQINDSVQKASFVSGVSSQDLSLAFGIASIPEDASNMDQLLAAAVQSNKHSRATESPIVLFQAIKS